MPLAPTRQVSRWDALRLRDGTVGRIALTVDDREEVAMETMIGIGVLLAGVGVAWICFALGVYFLTRTGREGMRIERMAEERRERHHS
jgi:hypothetical protein